MKPCIFCEIIAERQPCSLVYQDELCSAFLDIQPIIPGHLLIVPNQHAACLAELDAETGAQLFRVAQRLAQTVRKCGVKCEGVNFFLADGAAAGQDVFHVHLHVIPRFNGDGFGLRLAPSYYILPGREKLDAIAQKIKSVL